MEVGAHNNFPIMQTNGRYDATRSFRRKLPNDLPRMDLLGLTKRIYNAQEFYDLITGDQKDFGFLFMMKGYEAAIRILGCDDIIRENTTTTNKE